MSFCYCCCSDLAWRIPLYIHSSCLLSLLWSGTISQVSLVFNNLEVYLLVGYFVNDPHFGLSNVFLMGYSRVIGIFFSSFKLWRYDNIQETWKLQNKIIYRCTIRCNYFLSRYIKILVGVSRSKSQKLIELIYKEVEGQYSRPEECCEPIQHN